MEGRCVLPVLPVVGVLERGETGCVLLICVSPRGECPLG